MVIINARLLFLMCNRYFEDLLLKFNFRLREKNIEKIKQNIEQIDDNDSDNDSDKIDFTIG